MDTRYRYHDGDGFCLNDINALVRSNTKSSMGVWRVASLVDSHALAVVPMAFLLSCKFKKDAIEQTSLLIVALCTEGLLSIFSFLCRLIDFDLTPRNSSDQLTLSSLDRNYLRCVYAFSRQQSKQRHLRDCHTETEPEVRYRGRSPAFISLAFEKILAQSTPVLHSGMQRLVKTVACATFSVWMYRLRGGRDSSFHAVGVYSQEP
ncbi:hypothetical protein KXD40_007727 [Peronospora effusa]|nr:hypothetical protein KXD40_007727 [Peronospora effusa]